MRVTFFVSNYAPSIGGAQHLVRQIAEGLAERHGHDVSVLTTDALLPPGGPCPGHVPVRRERLGGVAVDRAPVARRLHGLTRLGRRLGRRVGSGTRRSSLLAAGPLGLRLALAARRSARSSDVVVGVGASFLTVPGAAWSSRRAQVASVALPLVHVSEEPPPRRAVEALARFDRTVLLTEVELEWALTHRVGSRRAVVIPAGCAPESYPELAAPAARARLGLPDRPTVGYVGRMAPHKGIDTVVEAIRLIWRDRPEVSLLLAGGRTSWKGFDVLVDALRDEAGDRLVLRREFSEDDKPVLFAACDVVAFPSREESFGMVTLEAWCARRPVVAGDIDVVRSLIRAGEDGDIVRVGDAGAWARALGDLLDDPARRERYGRAGRARAETEFSWPVVIDRWDDLVNAVAEDRSTVAASAPFAPGGR